MDTLVNKHDTLEQLIHTAGIRIKEINVHCDLNLLIVILSSGSLLKEKLSDYPQFKNATQEQLLNYELIGNGTGVHWPELDEDLSLKGFLRDVIKNQVLGDQVA